MHPYNQAADPSLVERLISRLFPTKMLGRVLLVNPPDASSDLFQPDLALRGSLSNFPPYGLGVLASHLRRANVEARVLNLNHEVLKACFDRAGDKDFDARTVWQACLDRAIAEFMPDLIGVTCMFTMTHVAMKEVCDWAARHKKPIAIGGVHVSNDIERVMTEITSADMAFLREADVSLVRFIEVVRGSAGPESLVQLVLRDNDGLLSIAHDGQPDADQLDVIPAYDLMQISELSQYGVIGSFTCFKPKGTQFATVLSNRGCRGRCTFCSVRSFNGKGVRLRSVDSVLDELEVLEHEHGIRHIMWLDDDLYKDERRAVALFNGMVKRKLKMTWDASNGVIASSCTEEVVAASAASGCIGLIIGMESGNPQILRNIRKPGTVDNFLHAAEVLRRHSSIFSNVYLIIGFPGETMGMIRDTIRVSREMALDWFRIKTLQPLPNTPIYDEMVAEGLIQPDCSSEIRYITGAYGKHHAMDSMEDERDIESIVASIPDDAVPSKEQLDDIWFYMNFHLNYRMALNESKPIKLGHLKIQLHYIADFLSPDNCFALYTLAEINRKLGAVDSSVLDRLDKTMAYSSLWRSRMSAFGLYPNNFPEKTSGSTCGMVSCENGEGLLL